MTGTDADDAPPLVDAAWLRTVGERVAEAEGLLLCLDFDGTLAPIVDDPDDATLPRETRQRLRQLANAPDVTVAVVSGRELSDLRERVDLEDIHYAGNHGMELGDGDEARIPDAVEEHQPAVRSVVDRLRESLADVPGCRVEDKHLTATVHLRGVPDDRQAEVAATVRDTAASVDGVHTSEGKAIVEVRPDVDLGKGWVVERLRDAHPDHVPLFVGDDVTDEDGFRAVSDRDGGVLVGSRPDTDATVRVPGPETVTLLLGWLVEAATESFASTPVGLDDAPLTPESGTYD